MEMTQLPQELVDGYRVLASWEYCVPRAIVPAQVEQRANTVATSIWTVQLIDANAGLTGPEIAFEGWHAAFGNAISNLREAGAEEFAVIEIPVSPEMQFMGASLVFFLLASEGLGFMIVGKEPVPARGGLN